MSKVAEQENKRKFRINKNYIFAAISLFFLFGIMFVWKWENETQLTNQISLITSWISISLAFLAILYAVYQTYSSGLENKEMVTTITKLERQINEISNIKNSVDVIINTSEMINNNTKEREEELKNSLEKIGKTADIINNTTNAMSEDLKSALSNSDTYSEIDILKIITDNAGSSSEELAKKIIEQIDSKDEKFVEDYFDSTKSENGYVKVAKYIEGLPIGNLFTPKNIEEHYKEKGINLTPGQIAGALTRLKNTEIIRNTQRGEYKKIK